MIGLRWVRSGRIAMSLLGIAASVVFLAGSVVALSLVPSFAVLGEYGIFGSNGGKYPGNQMVPAMTAEGARNGMTQMGVMRAVNGRPLPRDVTVEQLAATLERGGPVATITFQPMTGPVRDVRLTRSAAHAEEPFLPNLTQARATVIQWAVQALCWILGLFAAALVMIRRPRDPVAWLFAFQSIVFTATSSIGWTASKVFNFYSPLQIMDLLANLAALVLPFVFPDGRFLSRGQAWLCGLLVAATVVHGAESIGLPTPPRLSDALGWIDVASSFLPLPILWWRYRHIVDQTSRQQIKLVMFGTALALIMASWVPLSEKIIAATDSVQTRMLCSYSASIVSTLASAVLAVTFLASILRYRLYDADQTITRSVIFGGLGMALVLVFTGAEKTVDVLGQLYFSGAAGTLAGGIAAALVALLIGPLHRRVRDWAERRFRGELQLFREGLPAKVADMRETASLERLAAEILDRCNRGVHATAGALLVGNEVIACRGTDAATVREWLAGKDLGTGHKLETRFGDPLFPARLPLATHDGEIAGWLVLGSRPDGSFYGGDERDALNAIADPVARAMLVVEQRQRLAAEQAKLIDGYEHRISRLETMISEITTPQQERTVG